MLQGAACHGCLLIAETSCEQRNDFLDRALVVPTVAVTATLLSSNSPSTNRNGIQCSLAALDRNDLIRLADLLGSQTIGYRL